MKVILVISLSWQKVDVSNRTGMRLSQSGLWATKRTQNCWYVEAFWELKNIQNFDKHISRTVLKFLKYLTCADQLNIWWDWLNALTATLCTAYRKIKYLSLRVVFAFILFLISCLIKKAYYVIISIGIHWLGHHICYETVFSKHILHARCSWRACCHFHQTYLESFSCKIYFSEIFI